MKYSLLLVCVLLLGAGCTVSSSVDVNSNEDDLGTEQMMIEGTDSEDLDDDMIVEADLGLSVDDSDEGFGEEPLEVSLSMKSGNFFFEPDVITANAGQDVTITFAENSGVHTFVIDEIDFKQDIAADGTISFTAPTTPGRYEFYCDVGSHRQLGMKGTLVVE